MSAQTQPWWRGAAIYQVYPRSFLDTDGDGVGDLPGVAVKMDHIASLGVDAVWISPFYPSPMRDFGYDITDYCGVDPVFGTVADFDAVVAAAHARGVRVLVDQVYAHVSSDHPWFSESRADRTNPRADWFVWADPKPDGSPPNNWQSVFGGPAWTWDARRCQYYLHNFLTSQPQLNLHVPAVQDALLGVARFWLERGVDGFRLDALNFAMHDPLLRDNPPAPDTGKPRTRPFDYQQKKWNLFHPDTPQFLERLRALTDEYDGVFTLAEVGDDDDNAWKKRFTRGDHRLNSAYGFDFLYAPRLTAALVAKVMGDWPNGADQGWPCWAFENHDAPRAVSRWCDPEARAPFARLKVALLACLRGNFTLYQGEELGLVQDDIPFEQLQDPEAITNWPRTLSRDGARTPLPWSDAPQGGFTSGTPWLPMSEANMSRNVTAQEADPASQLAFTQAMLALRKAHPALRLGDLLDCAVDGERLDFVRAIEGERLRCLFNLSDKALPLIDVAGDVLLAVNGARPDALPPYGALIVRV
ncbi:MAG: DUF3459 domain-containing protein [Sphingomonadales bacterium]|nr:DUF3459 domain-containing protein [Sphingomonadales bacterium]